MLRTAKFAASRMCCASSMTTRRGNSLSLRSWNEKTDLRLQTSDFSWLHQSRLVVERRSEVRRLRSAGGVFDLASGARYSYFHHRRDSHNGNWLQRWQDGGA